MNMHYMFKRARNFYEGGKFKSQKYLYSVYSQSLGNNVTIKCQ